MAEIPSQSPEERPKNPPSVESVDGKQKKFSDELATFESLDIKTISQKRKNDIAKSIENENANRAIRKIGLLIQDEELLTEGELSELKGIMANLQKSVVSAPEVESHVPQTAGEGTKVFAFEKGQGEIDESDARKIIDAINTDLAKKIAASGDPESSEIPAEKIVDTSQPEVVTSAVEQNLSQAQISTQGQEADIPTYGTNPEAKKPKESASEPAQDLTPPPVAETLSVESKAEEKAPEPEKKEREYDKLGRQISDFEIAWKRANELVKEKKGLAKKGLLPEIYKEELAIINKIFSALSRNIVKLAGEMLGRSLVGVVKEELGKKADPKSEEFKKILTDKAKEIYEKKSGLYNTAKRLLKGNLKTGQIKKIINEARESGKYGQNGEKINGRLILGKNGKYYFEIAGKIYPVAEGKKISKRGGRPPSEVDALPVVVEPPPLPEQPQEEPPPLSETEQSQVSALETDFAPTDNNIRNAKFNVHTGGSVEVIQGGTTEQRAKNIIERATRMSDSFTDDEHKKLDEIWEEGEITEDIIQEANKIIQAVENRTKNKLLQKEAAVEVLTAEKPKYDLPPVPIPSRKTETTESQEKKIEDYKPGEEVVAGIDRVQGSGTENGEFIKVEGNYVTVKDKLGKTFMPISQFLEMQKKAKKLEQK